MNPNIQDEAYNILSLKYIKLLADSLLMPRYMIS